MDSVDEVILLSDEEDDLDTQENTESNEEHESERISGSEGGAEDGETDSSGSGEGSDVNTIGSHSPPPTLRRLRPNRGNARREYPEDEDERPFDQIGGVDVCRWYEDDIYLRYAAENARLPYDAMSDLEVELFPEQTVDSTAANVYVFLRNFMLNQWEQHVRLELTLPAIYERLPRAYRSLHALVPKLHAFLVRYGFINHGIYSTQSQILKISMKRPQNEYRVIVVGAGVAGLVAARQLHNMGFRVRVLEGRDRVGGRAFSHQVDNNQWADLGAEILEGSTGHPLMTVLNQSASLGRVPVVSNAVVYDDDANVLPNAYIKNVLHHFRAICEGCFLLAGQQQRLLRKGGEAGGEPDPSNLNEETTSTNDESAYDKLDDFESETSDTPPAEPKKEDVKDEMSTDFTDLSDRQTPAIEDGAEADHNLKKNVEELSCQEAVDTMLVMREIEQQRRHLEFSRCMKYLSLVQEKMIRELVLMKHFMEESMAKLEELSKGESEDHAESDMDKIADEDELEKVLEVRCLKNEVQLAVDKYEEVRAKFERVCNTANQMKINEPGGVFMTPTDRRLFDFFLANLERRLGAKLSQVSLLDWSGGFGRNLLGDSHWVDQGVGRLVECLAEGTELRVNKRCAVYEVALERRADRAEVVVRYQQSAAAPRDAAFRDSPDPNSPEMGQHANAASDHATEDEDLPEPAESERPPAAHLPYSSIKAAAESAEEEEQQQQQEEEQVAGLLNLTVRADACICAVPLGVLKSALHQSATPNLSPLTNAEDADPTAHSDHHLSGASESGHNSNSENVNPDDPTNDLSLGPSTSSFSNHWNFDEDTNNKVGLRFVPQLPAKHVEAIKRLGFGVVNKVVLCFNKRFWPNAQFLGRLVEAPAARGEFFIFTSKPNSTILNAHLSGDASTIMDAIPNDILIEKAMKCLRQMFGVEVPVKPNKVLVTQWHTDCFALGSIPYVRPGQSLDDYDTLATPVDYNTRNDSQESADPPRLFLCGDHTHRTHPASLHGAYLSGLRAAQQLADALLGPINHPDRQAEYETVGRTYEEQLPAKSDDEEEDEDAGSRSD